MAITFTQEKKKQRYLLIILGAIVLLILGIVWWGFSGRETVPQPSAAPTVALPAVKIDFDILKSPALEVFQIFADIPAFQGTVGRGNPFTPY